MLQVSLFNQLAYSQEYIALEFLLMKVKGNYHINFIGHHDSSKKNQ